MKEYKLNFTSDLMAQVKLERNNILVFEMMESVDGAKLSPAVEKALEMHPVYKTKLIEKEDGYCLLENNAKPVVCEMPWESRANFGTKEYNEFPWLIAYHDQKIIFIVAHFLTDGMGQILFMKTVLRFYLESMGAVFTTNEGILTDDEIKKTTLEGYAFAKGSRSGYEDSKEGAPECQQLPDSFYNEDDTPNILAQFVLKRDEISRLSHENGTSSFSELASIAGKSLARAAGLKEGSIFINTSVDLRSAYQSTTDFLFTYTPTLFYDVAEFSEKPSAVGSKSLRSQLNEAVKKEVMDAYVFKMNQMNGEFKSYAMGFAHKEFVKSMTARQAYLIYSHITHVGYSEELERHIRNIYITGTKGHNARMIFHVVNFKDSICINLAQDTKNDILADSFETCLKEEGISYERNNVPGHGRLFYKPECWRESETVDGSLSEIFNKTKGHSLSPTEA